MTGKVRFRIAGSRSKRGSAGSCTPSGRSPRGRYPWLAPLAMCLGLIAVGSWLRWEFRSLPNVSPVAALALYGGFFFARRGLALVVVLSVMAITDTMLGGYETTVMVAVYGMLAFPVLLGGLLRGVRRRRAAALVPAIVTASLIGSTAFFLVTNFACWWGTPWYEPTWGGLIACYEAALPFFRYTLLGDLGFAACFFGAHAVVAGIARRSVMRSAASSRPASTCFVSSSETP